MTKARAGVRQTMTEAMNAAVQQAGTAGDGAGNGDVARTRLCEAASLPWMLATVVAVLGFGAARAQSPGAAPKRAAAPAAIPATAGAEVGDRAAAARQLLDKWVEARGVISKEKRDWAVGRELLTERVQLMQREIEQLRGKIADTEQSIAAAEAKKADLTAESAQLVAASQTLASALAPLEARTRALLQRLPDPVRERVQPLSQRIPADPAATKLGLGERTMNVVGVLNDLDKWNRDVSVTSEVRKLQDGSTAQVTAFYVGLGQGYYATAKGDAAGIGSAGSEGWAWTPANDAAPAIARAIAILKNEQPAAFVRLPMRIR